MCETVTRRPADTHVVGCKSVMEARGYSEPEEESVSPPARLSPANAQRVVKPCKYQLCRGLIYANCLCLSLLTNRKTQQERQS